MLSKQARLPIVPTLPMLKQCMQQKSPDGRVYSYSSSRDIISVSVPAMKRLLKEVDFKALLSFVCKDEVDPSQVMQRKRVSVLCDKFISPFFSSAAPP